MSETYRYRARDSKGRLATGFLVAGSKDAAVNQLRSKGYYIIDIFSAPAQNPKFSLKFWEPKVRAIDLALYCRQLTTMVTAGVPILSSLKVMKSQAANKKLALISGKLIKLLEEGHTLTSAVQQFPDILPGVFIGMIKAGEKGGSLDKSLDQLAVYFEKEYEIREKIKAAATYPLIVMFVSLMAVVILLTLVLPGISQIFWQQDLSLPLVTRMVIKASEVFSAYWHVLLFESISGYFIIKWAARTRRGKLSIDRFLINVPIVGSLIINITIARICRTLSTLFGNGIPIIEAMDIVKGTISNSFMSENVEKAKDNLATGVGIAESLVRTKVFPPMVIQMVKVGENTGKLDLLLNHTAAYYERNVNYNLNRLVNLIEPVLIAVVSLIVGIVVSAVFLPVLKTIEAVQ